MAREIIWSNRAQSDRKSIFTYWNKRNKSNIYSKKLNQIFIAAIEFCALHPQTGRKTTRISIRIKFVSHFALISDYDDNTLRIMGIFDNRQNPSRLKKIIEHQND